MFLSEIGMDGRKMSLFIWIIVIFGLLIFNKSTRKTVMSTGEMLMHPKVAIIFILAIAYSSAAMVIFKKMNLWDFPMLADSLMWFFGTAVIFIMNLGELADISKFKLRLKANLSFVLILDFFINLYSFHIIIEILLLPILTLIAGIATLASFKKEQHQVAVFANSVLVLLVLIFIAWSSFSLITNLATTSGSELLRNFLIIPLLTITFLPFVYCLGIYSGYDSLFVSINHFFQDNKAKSTALKLYAVKKCRLNYWAIDKFRKTLYSRFVADESI